MAERDDDQLGDRYRALGREEPPAELDASILAASRRAVQSRPGRRRWLLPASIAAVIVLSVSVTLQLQHERADLAGQINAPAEAGKAAAPAAPPPALAPAPAPATAPAAADSAMRAPLLERRQEQSPAAAAQPGRMSRQSAEASPEQWLARIAELRREGRHDEAERQLADFRRRFPDYRIPQTMRDKVEPR
jgi:hypothetical protein